MKKVYQSEYKKPYSTKVQHYWFIAKSKIAIIREYDFLKHSDITLREDVQPEKFMLEL